MSLHRLDERPGEILEQRHLIGPIGGRTERADHGVDTRHGGCDTDRVGDVSSYRCLTVMEWVQLRCVSREENQFMAVRASPLSDVASDPACSTEEKDFHARGLTQSGSSLRSVASGSVPWPSIWSWKLTMSKRSPSRCSSCLRRAMISRIPVMYASA